MSNVCAFCQVKESTSVGKWLVRGDCIGRRDPPSALCDTCADNGFTSSVGIWISNASAFLVCPALFVLPSSHVFPVSSNYTSSRCGCILESFLVRASHHGCRWVVGLALPRGSL